MLRRIYPVSFWPVSRAFAPISIRTGATALMLATSLATGGSALAQTPSPDSVIAIVNGIDIRESDVRLADEEIGRNLTTQDQDQRREEILTMLIDTIVLSQEAMKQNIKNDADLQRRMTYARNQGLMNHLLIVTAQQAATEEAIRKAYDDVVRKVPPEQDVRLRHIVFKVSDPKNEAEVKAVEARARSALARIANGEDFVKVAAETSDDPLAKTNGGDYGWRIRAEMGKEYADAAFALKKGGVAPLIRTAFGWHIIKVEDQRTRKPMEFELVRERVKAMVMRNAQLELISSLREKAKVERKERPVQAQQHAD
jgi:peptidyl-prolyl cis-trans isomerase C